MVQGELGRIPNRGGGSGGLERSDKGKESCWNFLSGGSVGKRVESRDKCTKKKLSLTLSRAHVGGNFFSIGGAVFKKEQAGHFSKEGV